MPDDAHLPPWARRPIPAGVVIDPAWSDPDRPPVPDPWHAPDGVTGGVVPAF